MKTKTCRGCNKPYAPTSNRQIYCIYCRESSKKSRKQLSDKLYYKKNKDILLEKSKTYKQHHHQERLIYKKFYREKKENKQKRIQYEKMNRKRINLKQKEYYYNHKRAWAKRALKYLHNNVNLRIRNYLASRIRKVLKNNIKSKKPCN